PDSESGAARQEMRCLVVAHKKAYFAPFFARQRRLAYWWDRPSCLSTGRLSQECPFVIPNECEESRTE
ncbi:MAG TPA: hypothetical protein PLZ55_18555, partial [bacterium]|nr:hypothetical protein [bacterium]